MSATGKNHSVAVGEVLVKNLPAHSGFADDRGYRKIVSGVLLKKVQRSADQRLARAYRPRVLAGFTSCHKIVVLLRCSVVPRRIDGSV